MLQSVIVLLIIILDRGAKYLATTQLKPMQSQTIPIIQDIFHLTYTENRGAAFSILQNQRWLFIAMTIAFVIFAVYYLIKHKNEKIIVKVGLSLVLAGAVGNLIDRIAYGFVVDFLDFRLINFPVFNVADCAVVIGCLMTAYYYLFMVGKDAQK